MDHTKQKQVDQALQAAARLMVDDIEAPVEMVLDRLFTFSIAQSVHVAGSARTAELLREFAERIENGAFAQIEAANQRTKH